MEQRAALLLRTRGAGFEDAVDVVFGNSAAGNRNRRIEGLRADAAAGDIDDDAFDLHAGHAFGRIDGAADRSLRLIEVDDDAALYADRALMADAENAAAMGAAAQAVRRFHRFEPRDEANDLRRADVENRQQDSLAGGQGAHARRQQMQRHVWPPFLFGRCTSSSMRACATSCGRVAISRPGTRKSRERTSLSST